MSFDVIDTSVMPGDDIDPDSLDAAAKQIRSSGTKVSGSATAAHQEWAHLTGVYEAPEQGHLYRAMDPVKTAGVTFASDLDSGATALETFAETVRTIKAAVVKIRAAVKTFEDKIGSDGKIQPSGGYSPYSGGYKLPIQWNEDTGMVAEQHRLAGDINAQVDALRAAEIACANSLADITGAPHVPTNGPGAPPPVPHVADAQWYLTAPIDRKEDCGQQIAHAVVIDFVGGGVSGLAGLLGVSWSPTTGKFGNWWDTFKGSWSGVNKFVTAFDPVMIVLDKLPDPDAGAAERAQTRKDFLWNQVDLDAQAADPQHRYSEQPYRAWTNSVLNVGSWLLPPLKILTAAKVGKGAELAGDAAKAGDLAKAGEVTRFASAADLAKALRESGSLRRLGAVSYLVKTRVGALFGKGSSTAHALEDLHTPSLSDYDLTTSHAGAHHEVPPVRDGGGVQHPGGGAPTHTDPTPGGHPATHPAPGADGGHALSTEHPQTGTDLLDQPGTPGATSHAHPPLPVADDATRALGRNAPEVVEQVAEVKHAVQPQLQDLANQAWDSANDTGKQRYVDWIADHPGRRPSSGVLGSWAHKDLADSIRTDLDGEASGYRVRAEASFDEAGNPATSGAAGTVRPDVVLEREHVETAPDGGTVRTWEPVQVWDYKTGQARIAGGWRAEVSERLGIDPSAIEPLRVG